MCYYGVKIKLFLFIEEVVKLIGVNGILNFVDLFVGIIFVG